MKNKEQVDLGSLTGFEFESLCWRILKKLGHQVERVGGVADKGRDLIIHGPTGAVVVECKHQPTDKVGRQVVQKLHSAIATYGAREGLIITTGGFSGPALKYSKEIYEKSGIAIRLVDLSTLTVLGQKGQYPPS